MHCKNHVSHLATEALAAGAFAIRAAKQWPDPFRTETTQQTGVLWVATASAATKHCDSNSAYGDGASDVGMKPRGAMKPTPRVV